MNRFFKMFLVLALVLSFSFALTSCASDDKIAELEAKIAELEEDLEASAAELAKVKAELQSYIDKYAKDFIGVKIVVNGKDADSETKGGLIVGDNIFTVSFEVEEGVYETEGVYFTEIEWSSDNDKLALSKDGVATIYPEDLEAADLAANVTVTVKSDREGVETATATAPVLGEKTEVEIEAGKTSIVVGNAKMNGDFINGFTNSAYDAQVRDLINGYGTVTTNEGGAFVDDMTVLAKAPEKTTIMREVDIEDKDGNVVETIQVPDQRIVFTLNEDLVWNDGNDIKAEDYVFAILWSASKQWQEAGATMDSTGDTLIGYNEYMESDFGFFKGVELLGEYQFAVTVDGSEFPYFYEASFAAFGPTPMHVFAPQAEIITEAGKGSKLSENAFDYMATILAADGYRFFPTVSCGAYSFKSYKNQVVVLEKNDLFKGDFNGQKASIDYIIIKWVNTETDVDQILAGTLDLVTGVVEGDKIELAKKTDNNLNYVSYARNGYGNLSFHCDFGPTKEAEVRRSIAYLMDRDQFVENVCGGYGSVTNGAYGTGQWMYDARKAELDTRLTNYTLSIEKANLELDSSSYKFEKDGTTAFDASKATEGSDYYRYNAEGKILQINHLGTSNNPVTDTIVEEMEKSAFKAGIKYTVTIGEFSDLLDNYYYGYSMTGEERKYHMFNLATSFTPVFDPYYSFHSDFLKTTNNSVQIGDAELDELIMTLRQVEAGDMDTYADAWVDFQARFNEILPLVPLYANEYYDVFDQKLKGFETSSLWTWQQAILYATVE